MQRTARQRAKDLLKAQIADQALDVLLERGFDEVTAEDLSQAVGISRATFFRYFPVKEDVVVAAMDVNAADFRGVLEMLQPMAGETPWHLLYRIFLQTGAVALRDPERLRLRLRLVSSNPAIGARLEHRRQEQRFRLAGALAEHFGDPRYATRLAYVGASVLNLTWAEWAAADAADFGELLASIVRDVSGESVGVA